MSLNQHNFLIYLGWKTLGWALVFLGVTLLAKIMKMWLIHYWARELSRDANDPANRELARSREEAALEVCARMERNRRMRNQRMVRRWAGMDPPLVPATPVHAGSVLGETVLRAEQSHLPDLPPNYSDVVAPSEMCPIHLPKIHPLEVAIPVESEDDDALPPKYESLGFPSKEKHDEGDRRGPTP